MNTPSAMNLLAESLTHLLPFWIAKAESDHEFKLAARARRLAYGKHLPQLGEQLGTPDDDDKNQEFAVLLAYSKLDGSCIGTVRVQISQGAPLALEKSFNLPIALRKGCIAEISRLAIPARPNGLALRLMLIKAAYWYCRSNCVDRAFLCVRHPVDRQYRRFDLNDVSPAVEYIPMAHICMIPHRIFWFDVFDMEARWLVSSNPLHALYISTSHPDVLSNLQARTVLLETQCQFRSHG